MQKLTIPSGTKHLLQIDIEPGSRANPPEIDIEATGTFKQMIDYIAALESAAFAMKNKLAEHKSSQDITHTKSYWLDIIINQVEDKSLSVEFEPMSITLKLL